jgi:DNA-3-methyladenine glycosylase I
MPKEKKRCTWPGSDPLYVAYHDEEWGVPDHDDQALFEKLILDGFQAGLSWITILRKRDNFRRALSGFEPEKIARYDSRKIESLMRNEGIVRNRQKVLATVANARAYLKLRKELGSFDEFLWQSIGGKTKVNRWRRLSQLPAKTRESEAMSKALGQRGFRFVGPTICYAFMQAVGMVNDHMVDCFRYSEVGKKKRVRRSRA